MADTVNKTSFAAVRWQKDIVWVRVNIGFMLAELPYAKSQGHDVCDIEALLSDFDHAFMAFSRNELDVFTLSRRVETDESIDSLNRLLIALRTLRISFVPWLSGMNSLIDTRRPGKHDLPLNLMYCCGGEILNAHTRFQDAVEAYMSNIAKNADA